MHPVGTPSTRPQVPAMPRSRAAAASALLVAALALAAGALPLAARGSDPGAARAGSLAQAPSTLCVDAVQDSSVFEAQPDVPGGISQTLTVGTQLRTRSHMYMLFDIAAIPSDATVVAATLSAYLEQLQFQAASVMATELLAAGDDWDEASLTWNNQPGTGASFGLHYEDDTPGIKTWNALGLVEAWRAQGNMGLVLEGRTSVDVGPFLATFSARESTAHPGPSLCVSWQLPTFTPTSTITPTLTLTPTATSLYSPTPSATFRPNATITPTITATASPTATDGGNETPTATATPSATTEPPPTTGILVTDPGDGEDASSTDGRCADAAGACTLRAAVQHAARLPLAAMVQIRFARPMRIDVPHGRPLPPLDRDGLAVRGIDDPPAVGLAAWLFRGLRSGSQGQAPQRVAISGIAAGRPSVDPGLRIAGDGVQVQGLDLSGFSAGILLASGAQGALIGSDLDGRTDPEEGNRLAGNRDGLRIDKGSTGHVIRFNAMVANIRHGIAVAETSATGNHLTRNHITRNGRAAIAVDRGGAQVPRPAIVLVDPRTGTVQGTGCAGCVIELFADDAEQAARYVDGGTVGVQQDGTWALSGLALAAADGNLTASAMRAERAGPSTSRLSAPVPRDASDRWRLVEVPPAHPRAMIGRRIRRAYRLVDAMGRPVPEALLSFRPYDDVLRFETLPGGLVEVVIPTALALDLWRGQLHITLEAVEQRTGARHAVDWLPRMGAALELPMGDPLMLDLSDLSEDGLGARLRRSGGAAGGRASAASAALQEGDAVAVGFLVAPADAREGPYAWQENLAAGGGVYQLASGGEALQGTLDIHAPAAAFDNAGPSSACTGAPAGAVMAGWRQQDICWVPLPGSSAAPPAAGDATFAVMAPVDVPPAGALGATSAFTLYTVGHDTTPPVILSQLASGAAIAALPSVLASAVDDAAGVRASTGISVTLGGVPVPVTYDAASREIRVLDAARGLPSTLPEGAAELAFAVEDGFCNRATRTVALTIVRTVPATIFLPRGERGR